MDKIVQEIMRDSENQAYTLAGLEPLFAAPKTAKIVIVGQAPGIKAQESRLFWNDRSGDRLRDWMGMSRQDFYQSGLLGILPMDFYYPGRGRSGDLPPRKGFAAKWHPRLLEEMPEVELMLLVGSYAQAYYLGDSCRETLTETVRHYRDYLPDCFPLVHPSPRNQLWLSRNPWFENQVLPDLKDMIRTVLRS